MRDQSFSTKNFWRNDVSLQILSRPQSKSGRPFLVFVVPQPGNESPLCRVTNRPRNFDVAARFYNVPNENEKLYQEAEYVMTGGLSKFHSAYHFLQELNLVTDYRGYFFLDGDLEFDPDRLGSFLSFADAAQFSLAQPSVTRDSYCYWKMAYHQPGYVFRETSFVEVMAPYFSRAALVATLSTFTQSISTYGLDLVWPHLIGSKAVGVVDAFQIRHRDRVDHSSGSFYKYLKAIGIDLDEEERLLLKQYGIVPDTAHSKRGYFWKTPRFSRSKPCLISVPFDAPEKRWNRQIFIDLSIRKARWREARREDHLEKKLNPFLSGNTVSSCG